VDDPVPRIPIAHNDVQKGVYMLREDRYNATFGRSVDTRSVSGSLSVLPRELRRPLFKSVGRVMAVLRVKHESELRTHAYIHVTDWEVHRVSCVYSTRLRLPHRQIAWRSLAPSAHRKEYAPHE